MCAEVIVVLSFRENVAFWAKKEYPQILSTNRLVEMKVNAETDKKQIFQANLNCLLIKRTDPF